MRKLIAKVTNGVVWTLEAPFEVKPKASKQTIAAHAIRALGWDTKRVLVSYSPYCVTLTRKEARQDAFVYLATS